MFLTVTPNACIERTVEIPDFAAGEVHRIAPEKLHVNAGGKGINAARVAAQLRSQVLALAWVGKHQRAWFEEQLEREGVPHELIETQSDTRVCTNVLHGRDSSFAKTEIVEAGSPLCYPEAAKMLARFKASLASCELAAICGSYPPNGEGDTVDLDIHLPMMARLARDAGRKLIVDGKGVAFRNLVLDHSPSGFAAPWAIKPNCDEASALLEYPVCDEASERRAVSDLLRLGVEVVLLSCGARGAYLGTKETKEKIWFLAPPKIQEISPVGSGDALVGAFAAKFLESGDLVEAARWGVAAGAANASQKLSAFCTREDIEALVGEVRVA